MRSIGGTPTARCRSEQPWATPSLRNASILAITRKATRKRLDFRVFDPTKGHKRELRLRPGVRQPAKPGLAACRTCARGNTAAGQSRAFGRRDTELYPKKRRRRLFPMN